MQKGISISISETADEIAASPIWQTGWYRWYASELTSDFIITSGLSYVCYPVDILPTSPLSPPLNPPPI